MEKKMLSPEEVENIFGIKRKTLSQWRYEGKGPDYFKLGSLVRYKVSELEQWIEGNRKKCL